MKNINETVKSKYLIYILFLAGGLLLGWLLFHNSDTDSHTSQASETGTVVHDPTHGHDLQQNEAGEWTCSMHPQIRQDKPGKCPICAMDLIPVRKSSFSDKAIDPNAIQLSEEAAALAYKPPRYPARIRSSKSVYTARSYRTSVACNLKQPM